MSIVEVYFRALQHLGSKKGRVLLICAANIVLAMVTSPTGYHVADVPEVVMRVIARLIH